MTAETLEVRLTAISYAADGINLFEFRPMPGKSLPPYECGAHIDVSLGGGLVRSYSLVGPAGAVDRYVVAVKREEAGRGGSVAMHDDLRVGSICRISAPRNHFGLVDDDAPAIFIAGGIGITPIHAMIDTRERQGREWTLHYGARNEASAAFLDRFRDRAEAHLYFFDPADPRADAGEMDLRQIVASAPRDAHLYCCGPAPMIEAFLGHAAGRDPGTVHVEYFASTLEGAQEGHFTVVLQRSGQSFEIQPGQSILDVLMDNGVDVAYSCQDGICGSCEVAVLEGVPEHRDLVLTKEQQAANDRMMICCSGSKTPKLVIDA